MLLARTISAEGRSRAFVGGASVPAPRWPSLPTPLVAVHGQSDQHRLLRRPPSVRRSTGSAAHDVAALLDTYARLHAGCRAPRAS